MTDLTLSASIRELTGKGASRRLRRIEEKVPAILYGAGKDPLMLSIEANKLRKAMENEAFYSQIISLNMDGKAQDAVLRDIQRHPAKDEVLHLDFLRITGKEAITMTVPIHFLNEDTAPGVKAGGIVSHIITEIEVKCLPKNLPEFISIDIGELGLDESIHISQMALPQGVELTMGEIDSAHDSAVVSIHKPKRVEEPAADEEASAEEASSEESSES